MEQNDTNLKQDKFLIALFSQSDKTISEVCKKASVSRSSYYRWLKNPNFVLSLNRARNDFVKGNLLDVDRSILKEAKKGNVQAAKLVYERFDNILPPRSLDNIQNKYDSLSKEELQEETKKLYKELEQTQRQKVHRHQLARNQVRDVHPQTVDLHLSTR